MFIIYLLVGIYLVAQCPSSGEEEPERMRLPNARYLGMGYNAVTGNPDHNLHDPGFAFGVLKLTWTTGTTTSDGKFLVPDRIQALQTRSCGFQSDATTEFGARSYQRALSVDVSVEAGGTGRLWSARFTGSADYRKISEATSQTHSVYTSARAKCIQYQLSVNYLHAPVDVTDNFARAVDALPLARDDGAYVAFIDTFGTHFTSRVTMGAKMVVRSEFDELGLSLIHI